jgi:hypothetical protein
MRFMIIVKATPESEADVMPTSQELADMGAFNEELIKAGVMLAGEGLKSSRHGARLKYDSSGVTVTDGPFTETKELIAGFWIIEVKSRDEALAWMKRAPFSNGEELEMRQVFETEDFAVDDVSRDALEKEQAWREATQKPVGQ